MNGTQSTDDTGGVQPGDASNAVDPANVHRARVDAVLDAWTSLQLAAQGDVDLSRAQEKIAEWLFREGRKVREGQ